MNRPTTRRRSQKHAFEDDDAPAAKRAKTEVNGTGKKTNGAARQSKAGECLPLFGGGCGVCGTRARGVQLEGRVEA